MSDPHDREPADQATIDCWRATYGLDKRTPSDAARYWSDRCAGMAPAGAVAALGIALDDMDELRKDAEEAVRSSVAAAVAAERERCARIVELINGWTGTREIAAEIRGETRILRA